MLDCEGWKPGAPSNWDWMVQVAVGVAVAMIGVRVDRVAPVAARIGTVVWANGVPPGGVYTSRMLAAGGGWRERARHGEGRSGGHVGDRAAHLRQRGGIAATLSRPAIIAGVMSVTR